MKQIILTQDQFALVDDEDYERVSQYLWQAQYDPHVKSFYAIRTKDEKRISMSSFVLDLDSSELIDHQNHNTLDNQKINLRSVSFQENARNRKPQKNKRSKYKGVFLDKKSGRWRASIIGIHLGMFKDEKAAALAYNNAAIKHFKEFAYLNVIN